MNDICFSSTLAPPCELQCEELKNPLGIDIINPRFSWQLSSSRRDEYPTAYQLLVASSRELLQPGDAGTYTVRVTARAVGTALTMSQELSVTIIKPLTEVHLTTDLTPPQSVNNIITCAATPVGGAYVEYQFEVDDGNGWTVIRPYQEENTCSWTPTVADNYRIRVRVHERNDETTVVEDDVWFDIE